jgi:NAD(P)-dependent dehydrogenase (short-subunit alcohol dehydrogenase family)
VWSSTFDGKAMGMVRVSRAALAVIAEDGSGSIVNISGLTAATLIPNAGVTGVTNAGVQAFTGYLASEAAAKSVRVNAVCPGMTDTEGWRTRLAAMGEAQGKSAEDVRTGMTGMLGIRLGRWASPAEIASAVVFLASDAASYITGEVIRVDGGLVKGTG